MSIVNWGILSTARINRRLIPEMHATARGALLAVASRNEDQAKSYAMEWKIPKAYGSYDELLADTAIDIVYIPLPNHLHSEWVIKSLEAGKHVLCEKPLCLSREELGRIRAASIAAGKCVMEAFMHVHHPQTQLFKQIIAKGTIGDIVSMYGEFAATLNRPADNYRMKRDMGGGVLLDIGVYPISLFQFLDASEVVDVNCRARIDGEIDTNVWARVDFASGVSGQFFVSFTSEYSTRTSITGTKGRLDISHPYNAIDLCEAWLTLDGERRGIALPRASLYAGEIENMHDVVTGNGHPAFSLDDSARVLDTVLRIQEQIRIEKP